MRARASALAFAAVLASLTDTSGDRVLLEAPRPPRRRFVDPATARREAAFDERQRTLWQRAKGSQAKKREERQRRAQDGAA